MKRATTRATPSTPTSTRHGTFYILSFLAHSVDMRSAAAQHPPSSTSVAPTSSTTPSVSTGSTASLCASPPPFRHVLEAGRRVAAREFTRTSAGPRCRRCSVVGGRRSRVRRYFGRRDCADGRVPLFRMRPSLCKPIHHAPSMEAGDFSENLRGGVDSSFAVV